MDGDEPAYPALVIPDGVEKKTVTVWANGVPLDADLFRPAGLADNDRLPAIVLGHGWGGTKRSTDRYGAAFAENGMIALCVSQSSWGNSGGRLVQVGDMPEADEDGEATAKVKLVRKFVDPMEWVENCRACVDFLIGEPNADTDKIGAWGTSFGGGVAMFLAAFDPRIKALSIQVSALLSLPEPSRSSCAH
jgi:dienelactone hydrolase